MGGDKPDVLFPAANERAKLLLQQQNWGGCSHQAPLLAPEERTPWIQEKGTAGAGAAAAPAAAD